MSIEAMKNALELAKVMGQLEQAIAAAEQDKPVFHLKQYGDVTKEQLDCYIATGRIDTCPQHRKPLTDEQIDDLARTMVKGNKSVNWLARAIEAAHGINYQERKAD